MDLCVPPSDEDLETPIARPDAVDRFPGLVGAALCHLLDVRIRPTRYFGRWKRKPGPEKGAALGQGDASVTFVPAPMEDPALVLIQAIQQGDQTSLSGLYDKYSAALNGVILKVVPDQDRAEEILQDTFLKIWRSASSYDPAKGRVFTWMLNIARRTAIDVVRSADYKASSKVQELDKAVYRTGSDELRAQVDHIGVDRLLGGMAAEQLEVIRMAYYEGWSQQEIAERTGLPLGTVKSRTRAALLHLREAMKEHR